jgi:hypothetical protein
MARVVSCNRSSQHDSAPKERHNIAHGVKPWVERASLSSFPLSARSAAQSLRAAGRAGEGVPRLRRCSASLSEVEGKVG